MSRKKYTKEEVIDAVKNSESYANVFRALEIKINGGSYYWLKKLIKEYDIDTSHFVSPKEMMKRNRRFFTKKDFSKITDLSNGERVKNRELKKMLDAHNVKCECNICKISEWLGEPIVLDIDHIDENCTNNKLDNLQYLCPNCHRQKTIKFKSKKEPSSNKKSEIKDKCQCGNLKRKSAKTCINCFERPKKFSASIEEIKQKIQETNFHQAGKYFGVSCNALRKRLRIAGIDWSDW